MRRIVTPGEGEIFDVELEEQVLKANSELAARNREILRRHGVKAIDVMGSIGSGKTSLIELLVEKLNRKYRIAVFNGDLTTTIDSDRVSRHGAEVIQINTGKECHLDANLVSKALNSVNLEQLDLIFIENVGNLICPGEFKLGADKRLVVISVTEGPYMILQHPFIFMEADVVVINKLDLAESMGVEYEKLRGDAVSVNPKVKVVGTICRTGMGIDNVVEALGI
ncbi:hydrogenase nickel incorporation protein HypB [Candidatus Bathyarchaeota archaeon]|nr:hydrogenase nickel incorporation protein HypB [Candidatus Bathyarchaeota archaeon]